jgi:sporadic carbohydrate cluster protein (TIGR04323 family)
MSDPYFYNQWQNDILTYDLKKYNFPRLVLNLVKEKFPLVVALETLHEVVQPSQIADLCLHVQKSFGRIEFMKLFDQFAEEYIAPKLGGKRYLIKRLPTLNCVIPDQAKHARRLPFHQGIFYNNGKGMATMWMPLTHASGTNSMYIANLEDSRRLTKEVIDQKMNLEQFEERCLQICNPVEKSPGEVHLFTQEHIHGNVNNETGVTRCAIDWHVLPEGEEYNGREPGGFFRLPGDHEQSADTDYTGKIFISYVGNNSRYDKNIPLHFQRKVIDEYCETKGINNSGVQFENEFLTWLPILEHYIKQKVYGIVMLSIHSLPNNKTRTNELLNMAIENNVQLHFANEFCTLKSQADLQHIQTYLSFSPIKERTQ